MYLFDTLHVFSLSAQVRHVLMSEHTVLPVTHM